MSTERTAPGPGVPRASLRSPSKWLVLTVVSIGTLMTTIDSGIVNVSYPALVEAFDSNASTVLWVNVAYWVTDVGLLLTLGWIGDMAGRRHVFAMGFVVFTIGALLCAVSPTIWFLIGARVVQAIGTAMILANTYAIITLVFPSNERGKAIGVSIAVVGLGLTSGPFVGGALLDILDWRALYYVRAPVGLLGVVMSLWLLPRDAVSAGDYQMDFIGAVVLFAAMAASLLVINQGGRLGFGSTPIIGLSAAAVITMAMLVWSQRRSVRPILDFGLFRIRGYTLGLAVSVAHYLSHGGVMLVAPFFLISAMGFSSTKMGGFIASFYVMRMVVGPVSGRLSDRVGAKLPLVIGNSVTLLGLLWLSRLGTDSPDIAILGSLLLAGAGSAIFEPADTSVIMGSVPVERLGTASASVATARHAAFAGGVALAGAVFAIRERAYLATYDYGFISAAQATADSIARAFGDVMLAGCVLLLVAVALSAALRSRDRES